MYNSSVNLMENALKIDESKKKTNEHMNIMYIFPDPKSRI